MEVKSSRNIKYPPGVNGIRCINRILLEESKFDDFITALTIDDFDAIKSILAGVIDQFTKELPYGEDLKAVRPAVVPGDEQPDPYLKKLLF